MDFDISSFFQNDPVNGAVRIFTILFLIIFVFYSLLTIRQVSIMNHSLVTRLEIGIALLAWFQLVLGLLALVIVLFFV